MYTKTEIKQLNTLKRRIEKCSPEGGSCKNCEDCFVKTAESGRFIYYAFGCRKAEKFFGIISESPSTLKAELLEAINFELS